MGESMHQWGPLESHVGIARFNHDPQEERFATFARNPRKVVRKNPFSKMAERNLRRFKPKELASIANAEFTKLRELGVRNRTKFIAVNDNGKFFSFAVTDRIEGETLEEAIPADVEERWDLIEEAGLLYKGMIDYIADRYRSNAPLIARDIFRNRQVMWGKAPGEDKNHIHLVDVDFIGIEGNRVDDLCYELACGTSDMVKMETSLETKFSEARYSLGELLDLLEQDSGLTDSARLCVLRMREILVDGYSS